MIYTTNAMESLNMSLRKVIKTRGSFPNPDAALKLLYPGAGAHREEVDHAGAELESRLAAFRDSARRPGSARRAGIEAARKGGRRAASRAVPGAKEPAPRAASNDGFRAETRYLNMDLLEEHKREQMRRRARSGLTRAMAALDTVRLDQASRCR